MVAEDTSKAKIVSFRMSEGEYQLVSDRARSEGKSLSEHIREKVSKAESKNTPIPTQVTTSSDALVVYYTQS